MQQGLRRPMIRERLSGLDSWGQSRAPSSPTRCLGVQCGRSVRDPI
jgi:hypothetical protein